MNILGQVKEILRNQLQLDQREAAGIIMESKLAEFGADSLDAVEIAFAVEEDFGIEVPEEACEGFKTVGDIVNYVEKERGQK